MHNCSQTDRDDIANSFQWNFQLLQYAGVGLSVLAHFATTLFSTFCKVQYTGKNMKILLLFHVSAGYVYSFSYAITQGWHIISRFIYNECDLLVPVKICAFFRIPQSITTSFFVNFYIVLNLSNLLEKFSKKYRDSGYSLIFALIALAWAMVGTVPSFFIDLKSEGYMLNCASFEHKRMEVQKSIPRFYLIFNFISFGFVLMLILHQKWTRTDPVLTLAINKHERSREFRRTLWTVGPNFFLNFCMNLYYCYFLWKYATSDRIDGNNFLWMNTNPLYVFISPLLWCWTLKKFRNKIRMQPIANPVSYAEIVHATWNMTNATRNVRIGVVVEPKKGCWEKMKAAFRCKKPEPMAQPIQSFNALDDVRPSQRRKENEQREEIKKDGCLSKFKCFGSGPKTIKVKPMNEQQESDEGRVKIFFRRLWKGIRRGFSRLFCIINTTSNEETSVASSQPRAGMYGNNQVLRRTTITMT